MEFNTLDGKLIKRTEPFNSGFVVIYCKVTYFRAEHSKKRYFCNYDAALWYVNNLKNKRTVNWRWISIWNCETKEHERIL